MPCQKIFGLEATRTIMSSGAILGGVATWKKPANTTGLYKVRYINGRGEIFKEETTSTESIKYPPNVAAEAKWIEVAAICNAQNQSITSEYEYVIITDILPMPGPGGTYKSQKIKKWRFITKSSLQKHGQKISGTFSWRKTKKYSGYRIDIINKNSVKSITLSGTKEEFNVDHSAIEILIYTSQKDRNGNITYSNPILVFPIL